MADKNDTASKLRSVCILTAAAVTAVYGAVKGKGIFNGPRFRRQHEAVGKYLETHYPGSFYTPIQQTDLGWTTCIKTRDKQSILLMITESGGTFIFKEQLIK